MKQLVHFLLSSALLLPASAALPHGPGENAIRAAHARLYAQLADHSLLQIMLVVPSATSKTSLSKSREGAWKSSSDVLCVDVSPLRKAIETHGVQELPGEARKQAIFGDEFYRAVRFDPPRLVARDQDRDHGADLNAALSRFAAAKLVRNVTIELNHNGTGCTPDAFAVPAIRFFKRANPQARPVSWLKRLERGDVVLLGMLSIAELRSARVQREAALVTHGTEQAKRVGLPNEDTVYGALRVESAGFKPCYVADNDPLPQLVAWTLAGSKSVERWMKAAPETPKAIADLDAIVTEFLKPAAQCNCTLLVASTPVLAQVKAVLEREKRVAALYPETVTGRQVLAAFGFSSMEEFSFARDIGIESGEQFAALRTLGLGTRARYDKALQRYVWQFGTTVPDTEALLTFVRDEREAAAKGTTVKALRAERAKREERKFHRIKAASG
jgi:hypothetical protein